MSKIVTDTGLILPAEYTEDQFFEAGRWLAKIEHGMQWAVGDWYNAIPWGDKEAACEKAGLNYKSAWTYGSICAVFPILDRIKNLGFDHHRVLAIQELTDNQRTDLLKKSSKEGWTVARLRRERDTLLGRPEKVPVLEFDEEVDRLLSDLPASVSKKAKQGVKAVYGKMKTEFQTAVEKEVSKRVSVERDKLLTMSKEAQEELDAARKMRQGITAVMTEDEFKFLKGLVHPDRHPAEEQAKWSKGFELVSRLGEMIHPNIPVAVLRARGWERRANG